jgi:hypothetical protein
MNLRTRTVSRESARMRPACSETAQDFHRSPAVVACRDYCGSKCAGPRPFRGIAQPRLFSCSGSLRPFAGTFARSVRTPGRASFWVAL